MPGWASTSPSTDLVVGHFNEYLAAASLDYDDGAVDPGNDLAPFAPHGVYATTDGWLAIAVDGDEEYQRLVAYFGHASLRTLASLRRTTASSIGGSWTSASQRW